ncbi:MAG: hypothetical protein KDA59_19230 [Planctomycetales bacterium]|nr:hypothetical protein [Planctomycetales bacterium]
MVTGRQVFVSRDGVVVADCLLLLLGSLPRYPEKAVHRETISPLERIGVA